MSHSNEITNKKKPVLSLTEIVKKLKEQGVNAQIVKNIRLSNDH
ncbi:hypothetical protein [Litchfieldia alkalitelluris]|nr:hypothetical protein [Litchfieldia alkalitelluris]